MDIQTLIIQNLTQHDRTQLALTSKRWNITLTPLLWRSISILTKDQSDAFMATMDTNRRHTRHIESFQTRFLPPLMILKMYSSPNLVSLDIRVPHPEVYLTDPYALINARIAEQARIKERNRCRRQNRSIEEEEEEEEEEKEDEECDLEDPTFWNPTIELGEYAVRLLDILDRNKQLESFKLGMVPNEPGAFMIMMAPILPKLKHLELFHIPKRFQPVISEHIVSAFLRTSSSNIESITLGVKINTSPDSLHPVTAEYLFMMQDRFDQNGSHPALRLLRFLDGMSPRKAKALVPFIRGCTNLRMIDAPAEESEDIEEHEDWIVASPEFNSALKFATGRDVWNFRRTPDEYRTEETPKETDEWVAKTILTLSNSGPDGESKDHWHTINLARTEASTLSARAIVDCCHEGLNSLCAFNCGKIESKDIQSILSKAVHLRHLETNAWGGDGAPTPTLMAKDAVSSAWSCLWLVRLNLAISGIPRPDIKWDMHGRRTKNALPLDNCTIEESHALQRKIYRQIGRLVHLEELYVGYASAGYKDAKQRFQENKVQRNCLEMTLKSGLDELRDLKAMRVLGVAHIAHKIEAAEVDWMQKHWPSFHTILGLVTRPYVEGRASGEHSRWFEMMKGRGMIYG
jgi:hypothetical protein